ncbi:MAG: hypothetical protein K1X89_08870 [Myxococcaceae bacterium]|nr:hypothetical protein [Myxococcaceae bacterium]
MARKAATAVAVTTVVSLNEARLERRLKHYRERLQRVMTTNRRAVGRLYTTGLLFSKEGTRAGRDLLLAHQHLLRVVTLLDRLSDQGDVPSPQKTDAVDAIFQELDQLLERTGELTHRTSAVLDSLRGE